MGMARPTVTKKPYGYLVTCAQCGREHRMEYIADTVLMMDDVADDQFRLEPVGGSGLKLWPAWVCRNVRCSSSEVIYL